MPADTPPPPPDGAPVDPELLHDLAHHPHDAYFKRVFSDPARATALFRSHLPPSVTELLAWEHLALVPGSFVKHTLQQAHSDLLFTVPAGETPVYLYLLLEHQTSVDRMMPLRLLTYMCEIWQGTAGARDAILAPVLPFVLHQGPEKWTVSTDFHDLFGGDARLPVPLRPYVPAFRHALLDLSQHEPKDEEREDTMRVVLQLMKMARARQMLAFFAWLAEQVFSLPEGLSPLSLYYALHANEDLDVEEIYRQLQKRSDIHTDAMTTAQKLINQGLAQGREEGLEKGLEEGIEKGEWIGRLRMLEELMGRQKTEKDELMRLDIRALEQRFTRLQAGYDGRFKDR